VELVRELASELVEYSETTRRQVDALIEWLDRAIERLQQEDVSLPPVPKPPWRQREGARPPGAQARPRPGRAGAQPPAALRSVARRPEPPARRDRPREASPNLDAARLLAIEMAVSGHTRQEVDAHLREAFRVTDTAQLLDDVFGREGGEPRTGWTSR
jgi:hypothetical protein